MAGCFDRTTCAVNPTTGALTVATRTGSCTIFPGDQVQVEETETCWMITVNNDATCIPKIEPGDQVVIEETATCHMITINNVPYCIPKCRYYRDCEGNVLDDCERLVTCDDLADRGFISCIRDEDFDLVPTNVGGELVNCLRIKWDRICAEAEEISVIADDHKVLVCGNAGLKKVDPSVILEDMCFDNVPDLGDLCGTTERLILVNSNGCRRLARYNQATAGSYLGGWGNVANHKPPHQTGFILPADFASPTNYYSKPGIIADGGTDPNNRPGLNEARILNSRLTKNEFDNACIRTYEATLSLSPVTEATANEAYLANMSVAYRYKVDSGPWVYSADAGSGKIATVGGLNSLSVLETFVFNITFPPGHITLETIYLAEQTGNVRLIATTVIPGSGLGGVPAPRLVLRPAA